MTDASSPIGSHATDTAQESAPVARSKTQPITLCLCGTNHKCEHEWGGWREFDDGRGGEQVCKKCGMGAMAHSMWSDF